MAVIESEKAIISLTSELQTVWRVWTNGSLHLIAVGLWWMMNCQ